VPGESEALDNFADLRGGHCRDIGTGASRTTSSSADHDVRPVSNAATTE
jgi:hypothetical protein